MLNLLTSSFKAYSSIGSALIAEIDEENSKSQLFFKEVENWRAIETNYLNKISQLANTLRDKNHRILPKQHSLISSGMQKIQPIEQEIHPFCANYEFSKFLNVIVDSHKSLLSKINFDVFMVNHQNSEKLIELNKKLLDEQRQLQKEIMSKKELVEKIFGKKEKLRRQKEEEEMCQIFMCDSIDITIDQKMRKKIKIKEVQKQISDYDMKIKDIIEEYRKLYQLEKEQLTKIKLNCKEQTRCKRETLLKIHLHLTTYWKNLTFQIDELKIAQDEGSPCYHDYLFSRMQKKQEDIIKKLANDKISFVENSLRLINENLIDQLIEYTRDKQIKNKIKRIMQTNQVDVSQTDESCRQVKLIKKILGMGNIDCECMSLFRGIVNKTAKLRLNFVFIMQFFRINNQFQIGGQLVYSVFCLISQFLEACYQSKDSFALKQIMILLMTYYVSHPSHNGQSSKIYIIHFFKKHPLWRDIQYWQSILIQCIYLQKKNTLKMMIISEYGNLHRKKELIEAERSAILNQMLIVVRNMIIFEFTEKEVKAFANRFIKLLKQDQKFHKDVNSTIQEAVKQQSKLLEQQKNQIKDFYKLTFIRQKEEEYNIPIDVRKSYIM